MQTNPKIRIGTRGSDLALWQAHFVRRQLEEIGCEVSIQIIVTQGDRIQDLSFDKLEGKGFFTKEIEQALLNGEVDLAVHSHKDLETTQPAGLHIAAVSYREDASELLLMKREAFDASQAWNLKANAVIGTSSARRKAQIIAQRPDLEIKELRGNVPTRIDKLRQGQYDAILLARAGVLRLELDLSDLETIVLDPTSFIPAPAQGVLGLQTRVDDAATTEILQKLHHTDVATRIGLERSVLRQMDGGCQLPLGVYCVGDQVYVSYAPSAKEAAENQVYTYVVGQEAALAQEIVQELKK
ncbi:MAG: hydroxymethylbilane synthase [Crocinitomicaceae bacterium]|nr:hydroxymethylbilane synthase [Crocinitomicaceae bacterium]MBP6033488.1 hydroxymethylbilane synthase [Crocinitomicaceae bacterium]